jgi:hypothetical protein
VDDEVGVIAQNPLTLLIAFDADSVFALFLQSLLDGICDGLRLPRIAGGANHEFVGKSGDLSQVKNSDVCGFSVFGGPDGNLPAGKTRRFFFSADLLSVDVVRCQVIGMWQNSPLSLSYYRNRVFYRFAALAAVSAFTLLARPASPADSVSLPEPPKTEIAQTPASVPQLQPDMGDAGVVRAQQDIERIQMLINQGALPAIRLRKAQEDLEIAKDMSILRLNIYSKDLLPEQADQMVVVAQRIVLRRQRSLIEMQQLVSSGVISRAEAESAGADFERSQTELRLAETRAKLIQQIAETLRIEKGIASLEMQVETHPDWAGKMYTKYDGRGIFTPADLQKVSLAFASRFGRTLPISADGETAVHRSLGFDHRGRVDVAVSPDQPEGAWLMHFLETNKIPYFAFRMAIPGKATGAHIHLGPQSTRLSVSY